VLSGVAAMDMSAILVVIPARNEEASIGGVIRALGKLANVTTLVVDDGSTDATLFEAKAAGARTLTLPVPLGAWGAMQAWMRTVSTNRPSCDPCCRCSWLARRMS
jgi:hypothetical protein